MAGFCNQCGVKMAAKARFCPSCGAASALHSAPAPTPQPVMEQPAVLPPANPNLLPWIIAGAAVLGLVILGSYFAFSSRSNPAAGTAAVAAAGEGPALGPEVIKFVQSDTNIRSAATARGPNSQVVGTLKRGAQIKGTMHVGISGDAHWFKLSDGRGFVSAINLADAAPAAVAVVAAAPAVVQVRAAIPNAPFCRVATNSGNLRIRAAPNGQIIGGMPRGERFQAYNARADEAGQQWIQVQPVNLRYPAGWVSAAFVAC